MSVRPGWASSLDVAERGLEIEGVPATELVADHGTPVWVMSRTTLEENFVRFLNTFRDRHAKTDVAYSIKSNSTLAVVRTLVLAGAKVDCSSEYEIELALRCGARPTDVVVNGNGKSDGTLSACAERGVLQVNVDSLDEVDRLNQAAVSAGTVVECAVRVQLTYERLLSDDPSFESTLRIGEGKFGCTIANGDAMRAVAAVVEASNLSFVGLHHHVGFSGYMADYSPEREVHHHAQCAAEVCEFARAISAELGAATERLDLGGGFRGGEMIYLATPGDGTDGALHPLPPLADYAEAIVGTIEAEMPADRRPALLFETGGYQVANAATFLTRVVGVKPDHGPEGRTVVTVDGAMTMFTSKGSMRVASEVVIADRPLAETRPVLIDVVGQTCVYDSLAEAIELPPVARGDVLALLNHGAYCDTTGTQMNSFPRPSTVMVSAGGASLARRRETLDDVAARDLLPPELGGPLPVTAGSG